MSVVEIFADFENKIRKNALTRKSEKTYQKPTHCKKCYHKLEDHKPNKEFFKNKKLTITSFCKACNSKCTGKHFRK